MRIFNVSFTLFNNKYGFYHITINLYQILVSDTGLLNLVYPSSIETINNNLNLVFLLAHCNMKLIIFAFVIIISKFTDH